MFSSTDRITKRNSRAFLIQYAYNVGMNGRRTDFDVTNRIKVTEVEPVSQEVCRLYADLYADADVETLRRAFADMGRLYRGEYPGYLPCEAPYHDLQHTLDVTLAMARLLSGYERSRVGSQEAIGPSGVLLGLICALFHDSGYIRRREGDPSSHGAELTLIHVRRGCEFLAEYLPTIGLGDAASVCCKLLHFSGYEMAVKDIPLDDLRLRKVGMMLGSADLLAQMADRCYLEKCRDRLYPEFVASGMASGNASQGGGYASGEELVSKTPQFFRHAMEERLEGDYEGVYRYMEGYFGDGRNLYMEEIEQNRRHLEALLEGRNLSVLRRSPGWTLNPDIPMLDVSRYEK